MDAHSGTSSRADRGVRCPTRPFVPPASIAGFDPARIVASRILVPATSNHLEVVVTVFQGTRARREVDIPPPVDIARDAAEALTLKEHRVSECRLKINVELLLVETLGRRNDWHRLPPPLQQR